MAAGSCRRPQWLLWGLDQGLLYRAVPGDPHLGFHSQWLARGQMLTLSFQGSWEDRTPSLGPVQSGPGVQSLPK